MALETNILAGEHSQVDHTSKINPSLINLSSFVPNSSQVTMISVPVEEMTFSPEALFPTFPSQNLFSTLSQSDLSKAKSRWVTLLKTLQWLPILHAIKRHLNTLISPWLHLKSLWNLLAESHPPLASLGPLSSPRPSPLKPSALSLFPAWTSLLITSHLCHGHFPCHFFLTDVTNSRDLWDRAPWRSIPLLPPASASHSITSFDSLCSTSLFYEMTLFLVAYFMSTYPSGTEAPGEPRLSGEGWASRACTMNTCGTINEFSRAHMSVCPPLHRLPVTSAIVSLPSVSRTSHIDSATPGPSIREAGLGWDGSPDCRCHSP